MAKNIERESLVSALAYCSLRDLPKEDSGEEVWIYAIAKVEKSDGSTSYALVEKSDNGGNRFLKDFGNISSIRKVVSFHPYSFLKSAYLPKFKTEKKDERVDYLMKKLGNSEDFSKYSKKELDVIILKMAIKTQKTKENYGK